MKELVSGLWLLARPDRTKVIDCVREITIDFSEDSEDFYYDDGNEVDGNIELGKGIDQDLLRAFAALRSVRRVSKVCVCVFGFFNDLPTFYLFLVGPQGNAILFGYKTQSGLR